MGRARGRERVGDGKEVEGKPMVSEMIDSGVSAIRSKPSGSSGIGFSFAFSLNE